MLPTILTVAACGSAAQADRLRVQDRCRAGRGIFRKGSAPPRSARNGRARSPLRASTFNRERVLTLHAVSILGYDMPVDRIASRIQGRWDRHDETLLILGVCPRHAGCDYFPALVLEFQARKFCDHAFAEVELYLGRRASPDISHYLGASGRRISESCCATTTFWRFEERPDADRV